MQPALHLRTKVLPGKKIEIEISEGEIGDTVDVFVVLPEKTQKTKRSILEFLEESRSKRHCRSASEVLASE
jgi:hypothetical protein